MRCLCLQNNFTFSFTMNSFNWEAQIEKQKISYKESNQQIFKQNVYLSAQNRNISPQLNAFNCVYNASSKFKRYIIGFQLNLIHLFIIIEQVPVKKKIVNRSGVPKNSEIKDPDMPKKPATAYILYFKNRKEKFLQQYPNFGITEITKLIAKEWGELTKEKQIPFLRDAEKAKLDYIERMKEYASKHPGIRVPGEGRKRKNRPQGPLYQDIPIKKDGMLDGSSDDEIDDDDEDVEQSLQNISSNPPQQNAVKQTVVTPQQPVKTMNGKRKLKLSDEENDSNISDAEQAEDSFDDIPLKKIKS